MIPDWFWLTKLIIVSTAFFMPMMASSVSMLNMAFKIIAAVT